MSNSSFLSDQIKSSGKGIEEIYFRRNRIDRQFWRFDDSSVDLKFCDIRIMCVKWLNCLIWLKEFSQFRGKIQKCYIPNISDSNLRQSLSGSNNWIAFWNAFAKCISFCKSDFFSLFLLFTSCSHIIFGSNLDSIDTLLFQINSIFYDLDEQLFLEFYFVTLLYPPPLVQDKSVLNEEQERDSRSCSLFSTDLFGTERGYSKVTK